MTIRTKKIKCEFRASDFSHRLNNSMSPTCVIQQRVTAATRSPNNRLTSHKRKIVCLGVCVVCVCVCLQPHISAAFSHETREQSVTAAWQQSHHWFAQRDHSDTCTHTYTHIHTHKHTGCHATWQNVCYLVSSSDSWPSSAESGCTAFLFWQEGKHWFAHNGLRMYCKKKKEKEKNLLDMITVERFEPCSEQKKTRIKYPSQRSDPRRSSKVEI